MNDYNAEIMAVVLDVVTWERSPQHIADRIAEVSMMFGKSTEDVGLEVDSEVKAYRTREILEREAPSTNVVAGEE